MRVLAKLAFIAIAEAVRWLPTVEAGVHYQVSVCGICGGQTGTEKFFFVGIIPPMLDAQRT